MSRISKIVSLFVNHCLFVDNRYQLRRLFADIFYGLNAKPNDIHFVMVNQIRNLLSTS